MAVGKAQRNLQQENLMLKLQLHKVMQQLNKAKGTSNFFKSESQRVEKKIGASTASCEIILSHLKAVCQHQNAKVDRINDLYFKRVTIEKKFQPLIKHNQKIAANIKEQQEKENMQKKLTSQTIDKLKSELESKNVELEKLQDMLLMKEKNKNEDKADYLNLLGKFRNIEETITTKQEDSLSNLKENIKQLENELGEARTNLETITAENVILKEQLQKSEEQISELNTVISSITEEKLSELNQKTDLEKRVKHLESRIRYEIEDNSKKNAEIYNLRSAIRNLRNQQRNDDRLSCQTPKTYRKDTTSDNDSTTSVCSSKISFLQYEKKTTIERPGKRKYCGVFSEEMEVESEVTFQEKRTKTEKKLSESLFFKSALN